MRMTKIINGREYDTATAIEVHIRRTWGDQPEALYRSPRGQLFRIRFVESERFDVETGRQWSSREDLDWQLFDDGSDDLRSWLEYADAPRSVYEATGFEIEEG
jgi:hypothetical protein